MTEFPSDATLLERFANDREEAAFVALVRRHGPRVERICRRILRNEHDVEDVFQATFLVLARKAAGISWCQTVSPWIDGVARRLAMHARSGAARHQGREKAITTLVDRSLEPDGRLPERFHPRVEPSAEVERRDLRRVLDDELMRLPEKYRAPVVLCDLEGHTREEAARRLGWPAGSMSRRLDRARSLLRHRLTSRGVALGVIGLVSLAVAAAVGLATRRPGPDSSVQKVMAIFRPPSEGGDGYGPILAEAARSGSARPDFARILPAARAAAEAAGRIERQKPDGLAPRWYRFASEMRTSAGDLERACEESDSSALVAAARRLEATCVQCHAVFRRSEPPADVPESGRIPSHARLPDPSGRPALTETDPVRATSAPRSWTLAGGMNPSRTAARPASAVGRRVSAVRSGFVHLASNEGVGTAVGREGPGRWSVLTSTNSSRGRCPPGARRFHGREARGRPVATPA